MRLQDPSCDADAFLEATVEHPLFTEMIDLALSVLPSDAGPAHVKLLIEWVNPERFFSDMTDPFVEHESVSQMKDKIPASSALTLEQCLEHYTKAETLSAEDAWRCPHCQKYLPVVKTLGLWSLPDIMVIHFKRFRQQQLRGPQAAKLTTLVKFPLHGFDMTPHLARDPNAEATSGAATGPEDNWSPWRKSNKRHTNNQHSQFPHHMMDNRYDLYAVCYHQGDTLETGHYTAACKNPYDHQWYKFDDQRVNQVPSDRIQEEIVNNEAYILFYQRRKIDGSECSGTSSSSGADHWVSRIAAAPLGAPNTTPAEVKPKEPTPVAAATPVPPVESPQAATIPKKAEIEETTIMHSGSESEISEEKTPIEETKPVETVSEEPNNVQTVVVEVETQVPVESPVKSLATPTEEESSSKPIPMEQSEEESSIATLTEEPSSPELPEELSTTTTTSEMTSTSDNTTTTTRSPDSSSRFSLPTSHSHFQDMALWRDNAATTMSEFISQHRPSSFTYKSYESDAVSMIRGANTCSKDTLLFIDQHQSHGAGLDRVVLDDDDDDDSDMMPPPGSRALWISPVTPHKLITVSPKN